MSKNNPIYLRPENGVYYVDYKGVSESFDTYKDAVDYMENLRNTENKENGIKTEK